MDRLTREATNGSRHGPDARTMDLVSRAAFEIDDFGRIVELLHKRSLIVLGDSLVYICCFIDFCFDVLCFFALFQVVEF